MSAAFTEEWVAGLGATSFYTRLYTPDEAPKGLLVIIHGFIEWSGRWDHVASAWRQHGFAVFVYDQRGFGKTALDGEKRSRGSVYGKFSGPQHLDDIEFFIQHAKTKVPAGTKTFLFGHSMGGGEVLSFCMNMESVHDGAAIAELAGVIVSAPFVGQTHPVAAPKRWLLTKICKFAPNLRISAAVDANTLTHSEEVAKAFKTDPFVKNTSGLRGLRDMFDRADKIRSSYFQGWPAELPLLVVHGDADEGASFALSKQVFDNITATDKTFSEYKGARHELHNEPQFKERVIEEWISWTETRAVQQEPLYTEAMSFEPAVISAAATAYY